MCMCLCAYEYTHIYSMLHGANLMTETLSMDGQICLVTVLHV